ncbi:hypothetical protein NHX12_019029 [Muraenolepis orangiensis]|uniref:Calponin-homology (CH) domain-containing protein n=1 Tax=Muraenolepis orangiensis TaxID=630683 RepID=A0A9Q0ET06_9TELE|nr:hypothetical protein NHX12_019029 [Muraenolepis orangiensis]
MAGPELEDWFDREEFIGQISDLRVQNLQAQVTENAFQCDPPTEVQDLFRDIQDGRVLMALLEELSGCKLLHGFKKSSHRIFRLNNIAKVLTFLEERNVKLVSIDASDIADGNSSIILGLIWNIILFFQIKELTGNIRSQFPSTSSLSSIPNSSDSDPSRSSAPSEERRLPPGPGHAGSGRAIKKLLQWVQKRTRKYGVAVQDFGKSWTSGLAFLAVIKSIDPSLVDMRRALLRTPRENLEEAFRTAHYTLGIPRLLEPEDVSISRPEEQCIMTYVSQFLEHFPGMEEPEQPSLVIERSVSMGRLNTRHLEAEQQVKNSLNRSRLKRRPHTVDEDRPPRPAPRIFLSSVSEDRGVAVSLARAPPRPGVRCWASEDSLLDPAPAVDKDGEPRDPEMFAAGSSSAVGDSAIGSPDSWQEEGQWGQSPGGCSPCDSGTAGDVGGTPAEECLAPFSLDVSPDEGPVPEQFVDEGVYSLCSMESNKERHAQPATQHDEGENMGQANLDLNKSLWAAMHVPEEKTDENKVEQEREGRNRSQLEMGGDSVEEPLSLKLCSGTEKAISQDANSPEPTEQDGAEQGANAEVSPANGTLVTHTEGGLFYTNVDRGSRSEELFGEPLEPMDLFYPDKEDTMLPDPAQMDAECLPSVFGVFALQPAPVSEPLLPEIDPMGEGTDTGNPKVLDPEESRPKSHVVMIGGTGPVEQVGPTEDGNLGREGGEGRGQSIAKGNTETLRKAAGVFNSSDKQMIVPIIKINSNNADLGEDSLLDRELYLLLLLWLLLYCLWLLPQMEFRALPSLLFNLDH